MLVVERPEQSFLYAPRERNSKTSLAGRIENTSGTRSIVQYYKYQVGLLAPGNPHPRLDHLLLLFSVTAYTTTATPGIQGGARTWDAEGKAKYRLGGA